MSIEEYGTIKTDKTTTIEAVNGGTRTTIVDTDKIGQLTPYELGDENTKDGGICISSVVVRTSDAYDTRTTVRESIEDNTTYRVVATASEDPIETHTAFKEPVNNLGPIAGTGDDPQNGAKFDGEEEDSKFSYFPPNAENDLAGVDSYLVPGVILEITKKFNDFADVGWDQIYKIAKIATPDVKPALNVGQVRTWLIVGVQYDFDGVYWTVTLQYQLSGPKGWNELIYTSA